jgi:hypothetical protein
MDITPTAEKNDRIEYGTMFTEAGDQICYYTKLLLSYKLKTDLSEDVKKNLFRRQSELLNPFMEFYQILLDDNLIEVIE